LIRLFKSSTVYPEYLDRFYALRPGLESQPYEAQLAEIMSDRFGWSDFWKQHLESTGRFAAAETIFNYKPLQKAWARDAGARYSESNWMVDILQAQMEAFKPDVWFVHGYEISPELRLRMRNRMPWIRWVIGWDGIVKNDADFYAGCDHVLVCHPDSAAYYPRHGMRAHHFRLGFETSLLDKAAAALPLHQVTFVGGVSLSDGGHNRRLEVLDQVSRKLEVSYWLSGNVGFGGLASACVSQLRHGRPGFALGLLSKLPAATRLGRLSRGAVFGLEMYRVLAASRIVLNVHIDSAREKAANMRLFEATGAGSCLVTDWKENLGELFDVEREIVTFRSPGECVDKIRFLLQHEKERAAIARAGQIRTLRDHSLGSSINAFADELTQLLDARC
jgi:spore maturation protein CgeB